MARIIVKSGYIRPQDPGSAEHLYNLVAYMATRPGVELVTEGWEQRPPTPHQEQLIRELIDTMPWLAEEPDYEAYQTAPSMATASRLIDSAAAPIQTLAPDPQIPPEQRNDPATEKQKRLIDQLLKDFPNCRDSLEYEDYLASPTKGSASELISHAMEENMFRLGSREAYIQYLAMRPGAERAAGHGLFSASEKPPDLHEVAATVANHPGNVWTHIVSLRREDAEKLCMASAKAWQALLRTQSARIAQTMHILPLADLQWYAAFHNEGHHPHIHMVAYSTGKEPYMGKKDIEKLKSSLAREIFRSEMVPIYAEQTAIRDALAEQSRNELASLISAMENGSNRQPELEADLRKLAEYMRQHKGKAVYGYLPQRARELVNGIVDRLEKIPEIAGIYDRWYDQRNAIVGIYTNKPEARQPLSKNKAFRSVKNAVVRTAVELASGAVLPTRAEAPEEPPLAEIPVAFPDPPYPPEPETAEDFLERHPYPGTGSLPDDIPPDDEGVPGGELPPAPDDPGELPPPARGETDTPGEAHAPNRNLPDEVHPAPGRAGTAGKWWSEDYKQARLYLYGSKTVQPDLPRAYAAMTALAKGGNALAQCDLGRMLADGIACDKDPDAAQGWYARALAGFTAAQESQQKKDYWQYRIGKLHAMGFGTEQNYGLAAEWYGKAVQQNNPFAAYALASQYCRGQGVPQDNEKAFGLYTLAAEHETRPNAYAMYELGRMCQNGIGTPADPAAAEKWYAEAYQGFLKLEETVNDDKLWYRLGQMCLQGLGTEQDYGKAKDYFEKAAALKNANAYYGLGRLYETPVCTFYDR